MPTLAMNLHLHEKSLKALNKNALFPGVGYLHTHLMNW
jgi:hypothetical protein